MTTRRRFLWVCGASTAGTFWTGEARGLVLASSWRGTGAFDAVTLMKLAEETRVALAALKPREVEVLRVRYGTG